MINILQKGGVPIQPDTSWLQYRVSVPFIEYPWSHLYSAFVPSESTLPFNGAAGALHTEIYRMANANSVMTS